MPFLWPQTADLRKRRAVPATPQATRRPVPAAPMPSPQFMERDLLARLGRDPANTLAHMAALFSVVFILSPGIDLLVSGWFAGPSGDFDLARVEALLALRDLNRLLTPVLLVSLAALLLAQASGLRHPALPRPHEALFVLAFHAVGPGLLVNGLKLLVGRARPRTVAEFGGADLFTPAWTASAACARNCSFPSGEAGSAVALLAFVFLLPTSWRRPTLVILVPLAIAFSVNRILFGAHFLSDVVLSWLMVGALMLSLRPLFTARAEALDAAITGSLARLLGLERPPARRASRPV